MRRTPIRTAVVAVTLAVALALPAAAGAASRVASPTSARIAVVTVVVNATNAWLRLVIAALPPNPCIPNPGPPEDPVCLGFVQVLGAYEALGATVADACEAGPDDGLGDAVATEAVAPAGDLRTRLIVRQLNLITAVLGYANDRIGILIPSPGPPDAPTAAALAALYDAVVAGALSVPPVDADGTFYPPNPCLPDPGPPD